MPQLFRVITPWANVEEEYEDFVNPYLMGKTT
jgi:hypothetical protein